MFGQSYMDTGSPTVLLQQYLGVATKGTCTNSENDNFDINQFDRRKALLAASIKGTVIFDQSTMNYIQKD